MSVCVLQNLENTEFYGPIFLLLAEEYISFKFQSRTSKTDDFSSPVSIYLSVF